jgi:hypothetical protein
VCLKGVVPLFQVSTVSSPVCLFCWFSVFIVIDGSFVDVDVLCVCVFLLLFERITSINFGYSLKFSLHIYMLLFENLKKC